MTSYKENDFRLKRKPRSKPRSKLRPKHKNATKCMIYAVSRGRYDIITSTGQTATAITSRELGKESIVVGDIAKIIGTPTAGRDDLVRIVSIQERTSYLNRTTDDARSDEKTIVANATHVAIIASTTNPESSTRYIDRIIVSGISGNLTPILIFTKTDLKSANTLRSVYSDLGYEIFETNLHSSLSALGAYLFDKMTVFVGASGTGKSTLINRLIPNASLATSEISEYSGRGKHTSSSSKAFRLSSQMEKSEFTNNWIIDTPGIRSFGMGHIKPEQVLNTFTELVEGIQNCPRSCNHLNDECSLDEFVINDTNKQKRLVSFRRILASLQS